MKTGFLLKFLALPFLVLFGGTPRAQFLPIFHFGIKISDSGGIKRVMEMKNKK